MFCVQIKDDFVVFLDFVVVVENVDLKREQTDV